MEAYPLHWPIGYQRSLRRVTSRFDQSMSAAQQSLREEIKRLGGSALIISTNLRIRADGMLYAADMNKKVEDPGVAIYFKYQGKDIAMCCDKYERVWENIYALAKGVDAMRGLDRWGVSDFLSRAFTGFAALPAPEPQTWWTTILNVSVDSTREEVRAAYLKLIKEYHPESGNGDRDKFQSACEAYKSACKQNKWPA